MLHVLLFRHVLSHQNLNNKHFILCYNVTEGHIIVPNIKEKKKSTYNLLINKTKDKIKHRLIKNYST